VQKITFTLKEGLVKDPVFVQTKETGGSWLLSIFKSSRVSNTQINLIIFQKKDENCLNRMKSGCSPLLNQTIWTIPTIREEITTNLQKGEYVSRISSFIYNPNKNKMELKDREDFSFAVK